MFYCCCFVQLDCDVRTVDFRIVQFYKSKQRKRMLTLFVLILNMYTE